MKWKKRKESLSSTLEKRKEKFLSNCPICLYSSQPTWEATYVPHSLSSSSTKKEISSLLTHFFFFFFTPRTSFKEMLWPAHSRFNKIPILDDISHHHPPCIGLNSQKKITIIPLELGFRFFFLKICFIGLLSKDTRRESDDTAQYLIFLSDN